MWSATSGRGAVGAGWGDLTGGLATSLCSKLSGDYRRSGAVLSGMHRLVALPQIRGFGVPSCKCRDLRAVPLHALRSSTLAPVMRSGIRMRQPISLDTLVDS